MALTKVGNSLRLDRFGATRIDLGEFLKGKTIEVVGRVERLDPPEGVPDGKPSYRMAVTDWRMFRIVQ